MFRKKRLLVSENPGITGAQLVAAMAAFENADGATISACNHAFSITIDCMVSGRTLKATVIVAGVRRFGRLDNVWRLELEVPESVKDIHLLRLRDRLLNAMRTLPQGSSIPYAENAEPIII